MKGIDLKETPKQAMSASDDFLQIWGAALGLQAGERIEIPMDSRDQAKRAQFWFYNERKREKRKRIVGAKGSGALLNPDDADIMRGISCYTRGATLFVERPKPIERMIIQRADGKRETIELGKKKSVRGRAPA